MRAALLFLCAALTCSAQTYRVETLAGTGAQGYAGDGSSALRAVVDAPSALALDRSGRVYVSDATGRVRRIEINGSISTVFGPEEENAAPIKDIAIDAAGNLYFATAAAVRQVSVSGIITLFLGPEAGLAAVEAIAVEPEGSLLIADGRRLLRLTAIGEASEILSLPAPITGIASAAGQIYVLAGNTIYKGDRSGVIAPYVTVPASDTPARLAIDRWGDLYVSGASISKVTSGNVILVTAADGPGFTPDGADAVVTRVNRPLGIAVDSGGNIVYADSGNNRVRTLRAPFAGAITLTSPSVSAREVSPRGLVLRWSAPSSALRFDVYLGRSPDDLTLIGSTSEAQLALPALEARTTYYWQIRSRVGSLPPLESGVGSFSTTNLIGGVAPPLPDSPNPPNFTGALPLTFIVTWRGSNATRYEVYVDEDVNVINRAGITSEPSLSLTGLKPDTLYYWRVLAVNDSGQTWSPLWQFSTGSAAGLPWLIQTFAGSTLPGADGSSAVESVLRSPRNPATDTAGNVYFIDSDRLVRRIGRDGKLTTVYSSAAADLVAVAVDISQNIYVAASDYIVRIGGTGQRTVLFGDPGRRGFAGDGGPASAGTANGITALATDRRGNLYFSDSGNNRVRVIGTNGQVRTFAGNGTCSENDGTGPASSLPLCAPGALTTDLAGNVYIGTATALLRISSGGNAERISGVGALSGPAEGGAASGATLGPVGGLAADLAGNLFVLDARAMVSTLR